jgi:NADH-quinone oxidoreductase subunit J
MNITAFVFYVFHALAAVSALGILFTKNILHAALFLLSCLISLAAIYIYAMAEWMAITQVLVYAAGIVIIIIFGIMLTRSQNDKPLNTSNARWFGGLLAAGGFGFILFYISQRVRLTTLPKSEDVYTFNKAGTFLVSDYALPFELAGLLLLLALVAAVVISSTPIKRN